MNTSVQIKTHTNHSASIRNVENLRESEQFKNPHIEVLLKTLDYKFEDDVIDIPKADKKSEKQRQDELRKVNNKINTYKKRLEVFKEQNNTKKIESLSKQIADLQMQKEDLKAIKSIPETRGKKREKNYLEFIFALTNSNQYIHNVDMQNVLKRAFERMKKTKVIKQLEGITGAMHLDQHSLHIHYLAKLPVGKTWDNIVNEDFKDNPEKTKKENAKEKKKISAKTYKKIQDTFQKFVKEEIVKANFRNVSSLTSFTHRKGVKYLPLKKYKQLNPIVDTKKQIKEPTSPRIDFKKLLDDVDKKAKATVSTVADNSLYELENDFDFDLIKKTQATQKAVFEEKTKTTIENDSSLLTKNNPDKKNNKKSRSK